MSLAAIQPQDETLIELHGVITARTDETLTVQSARGSVEATQAVSCLVRPEVGDQVIVRGPRESALYVTDVLARVAATRTIAADGDLELDVNGKVTVHAKEGINLLSPRRVVVATAELAATAGKAALESQQARVLANVIDATAERISSRFSRVFRRVFELEHVRSGQLDYVADGNVRMHGDNTILTARELVKADGKQIHMG